MLLQVIEKKRAAALVSFYRKANNKYNFTLQHSAEYCGVKLTHKLKNHGKKISFTAFYT